MVRPRLSSLRTWERHQERVCAVLVSALAKLRTRHLQLNTEVYLNREMYWCLLEANDELWRSRRGGFDHPPDYECKNPPAPEDEERMPREDKIPDFMWGYIDHAEKDPRRQARYLVIECKRLGTAPRGDWLLNRNYVQHGVLRFLRREHGYAKGERSAVLVGYVQDMEYDAILAEVNQELLGSILPPLLAPADGWLSISRLDQNLLRPGRQPPLLLVHLWADVRPGRSAGP
jgi:hypothetical protein